MDDDRAAKALFDAGPFAHPQGHVPSWEMQPEAIKEAFRRMVRSAHAQAFTMGKFRNFPENSIDTLKRCTELLCAEEFEITGDRRGGASGSYPVKVEGRTGWVKPANTDAANAGTAAHEKIVADLAYALGFPVAPAMLTRGTKDKKFSGNPVPLPTVAVISFDVLSQPKAWAGISANLTDKHKAALAPQLSALLALNCWVDDHDHAWNEGNALFEINDDGTAQAVFFDYAWSLSHQWKPPADPPDRGWKGRNGPYTLTENAHIIAAVEQIEQLAVKELEYTISRIPPDCLPADVGKALIAALVERRKMLRSLLNLTGAP